MPVKLQLATITNHATRLAAIRAAAANNLRVQTANALAKAPVKPLAPKGVVRSWDGISPQVSKGPKIRYRGPKKNFEGHDVLTVRGKLTSEAAVCEQLGRPTGHVGNIE